MRRTLALVGAAVLGVTGLAGPASADPGFDGVIINEVAAELDNASGPNGPVSGGYIELLNTTTSSVDVSGWTVEVCTTTNTACTTIPFGTLMAAGEFYVIADSSYAAALGPSPDQFFSSGTTLEKEGGVVRLLDDTGELEDCAKWGNPPPICGACSREAGVSPTSSQSINRGSPWFLNDPTPQSAA